MEHRNGHPESWFWETEEGRSWLIRRVVATLYTFGLKRGVGAETIREYFSRLCLGTPVGCSPRALRRVMQRLEDVIREIGQRWQEEGVRGGEAGPIIGAVDETCFERMMLVFMDLVSGNLVFEEVAEDRTSATWQALVAARLEALGVGVLSLVSDRAKALIKLAETGLECLSIPEVFHRINDLVTSYSLAIFGRLRHARQALSQAQASRNKCQVSGAQTQQAQAAVEASAAEVERWANVGNVERRHLLTRSMLIHPWRICDSTRQTSEEVACQLKAEIDAIDVCIDTQGLPIKKKALDKVRKQRAGLSALVNWWWQGVWDDGQHVTLPPLWTSWVAEGLLPLLSWQEQRSRTRCPRRKAKLLQALAAVQAACDRHPITAPLAPDVLEGWQAWAAAQAKALQRASSAVEGRNGYLSGMHHNHRGLPKSRYKVWTVLHHVDGRASDGTTPAARFFRRGFPDLFETVLAKIEDLPRPRQRHQAMALSG
jgi:hypothetical protein